MEMRSTMRAIIYREMMILLRESYQDSNMGIFRLEPNGLLNASEIMRDAASALELMSFEYKERELEYPYDSSAA